MWGFHAHKIVWPELAPLPTDHVVKKPTYSGFVGSRLEDVLVVLQRHAPAVEGVK